MTITFVFKKCSLNNMSLQTHLEYDLEKSEQFFNKICI